MPTPEVSNRQFNYILGLLGGAGFLRAIGRLQSRDRSVGELGIFRELGNVGGDESPEQTVDEWILSMPFWRADEVIQQLLRRQGPL